MAPRDDTYLARRAAVQVAGLVVTLIGLAGLLWVGWREWGVSGVTAVGSLALLAIGLWAATGADEGG